MALVWNEFMDYWEEEEDKLLVSPQEFPCGYEVVLSKKNADILFQALLKLPGYTNEHGASASTHRVYQAFSEAPEDRYYANAFGDSGVGQYRWKDAPRELIQARKEAEKFSGFSFPYVLINKYTNCRVGINPHQDREDIGSFWPILGLSLGAERDFQVTNLKTRQDFSKLSQHGSIYTMPPQFQGYWLHEVPKSNDEELDTRISLTFRHPRKARVVHILNQWERNNGKLQEPYNVYMGRHKNGFRLPNGDWQEEDWGNPFSSKAGSLAQFSVKDDEVMPKFQAWFEDRIRKERGFAAKVMSLTGKRLGCWCRNNKPCHAQIIASWTTLIAEKWDEYKPNKIKMQQWLKEGQVK